MNACILTVNFDIFQQPAATPSVYAAGTLLRKKIVCGVGHGVVYHGRRWGEGRSAGSESDTMDGTAFTFTYY